MPNDVSPTDPDYEQQQGRIALWLAPDDLRWLARHLASLEPASSEETDLIARIRFRIAAALHRAGHDSSPWSDE
jgi:hypothetical protein